MGTRMVKNFPSPRLMETIGATNQKPAEAIGELVANSFDARIGTEKLNIKIDVRNHKIIVTDDGKGMTFDVLAKAVCIAEDMSKYIERGEGAKGHFGMGFKTSCSTLGRYYEIYTKPIDEDCEYHVGFDISEYSLRPSGEDAWNVEIEDKKSFSNSPLKDCNHGTAFVISHLKDKNITLGAVRDYLSIAFKGHLKTGDNIQIVGNDTDILLRPKEGEYIPGSRIEIDEVFGDNDKYKITGWVALSKITHNDGFYGFNIYRHNQLVEQWNQEWFRPHLMTSRIIGEVNMDFLEATFYKQGVQQAEDWNIVKCHMTEFLKPIVSASRKISKNSNVSKPVELKKIITTLNEDYGTKFDSSIFNQVENPKSSVEKQEEKEQSVKENVESIVHEESLKLEDEEIKISYCINKRSRQVNAPFDYIYEPSLYEENLSELQVIVFNDHPLWSKKIDDSVKKIIATSDAIYRVLVEEMNMDTLKAVKIRNEWINQHFIEKEENDHE